MEERAPETDDDERSRNSRCGEIRGFVSFEREALSKIEGFDVNHLEEARAVAGQLREQSAAALTRTSPIAQRQALGLRNRLLTLLVERVRRARRAAQYVFRNHAEIVRKFSSAYERRQRTARRRNAKEAEGGEHESVAPTAAS